MTMTNTLAKREKPAAEKGLAGRLLDLLGETSLGRYGHLHAHTKLQSAERKKPDSTESPHESR